MSTEQHLSAANDSRSPSLGRFLLRVVLFSGVWWVLSQGDPRSWIVGAPAVVVAGLVSLWLTPAPVWRLSPLGALRFIPFFITRSFVGGVDVAMRAFHPSLPISPELRQYRFRLSPGGPARVFYASVLNLLPGTLSAELDEHSVTLHVLDRVHGDDAALGELEERVAAIFGERLAPRQQGQTHAR